MHSVDQHKLTSAGTMGIACPAMVLNRIKLKKKKSWSCMAALIPHTRFIRRPKLCSMIPTKPMAIANDVLFIDEAGHLRVRVGQYKRFAHNAGHDRRTIVKF